MQRICSLLILALCMCCIVVEADQYNDLCRLFKNGTKLRRPGSCTDYIECDGITGYDNSCPESMQFDRNKQACVDTNLLSDNTCDRNYCEGVNGKWVSDPTNCNGFLYCLDGVGYQGFCEPGFHFDEKTQYCIFDTSSSCITLANLCDIVPDGNKFRDETDCTYYYSCKNGVRSRTACSKKYFDLESGNCVEKSMTPCTAHPNKKVACAKKNKPVVGYVADGATCRGYFYCKDFKGVQDINPTWGQCPEGKFFSGLKQSCVEPLDTYCAYNRCQGRENMYVQTSSDDCHSFTKCENGVEIEKVMCKSDYFFDEKQQACVAYIIDYASCDDDKVKKAKA